MAFFDNRFIHYGLGNLFFDQMAAWQRPQFIDRHVFYDGRYIHTELITTMLEDSARPRLMNDEERQSLLLRIFEVSGW
jgi:poly-gamma-glutamate synthesis protein (capsule biosynthesis protein)